MFHFGPNSFTNFYSVLHLVQNHATCTFFVHDVLPNSKDIVLYATNGFAKVHQVSHLGMGCQVGWKFNS